MVAAIYAIKDQHQSITVKTVYLHHGDIGMNVIHVLKALCQIAEILLNVSEKDVKTQAHMIQLSVPNVIQDGS